MIHEQGEIMLTLLINNKNYNINVFIGIIWFFLFGCARSELRENLIKYEVKLSSDTVFVGDEFSIITSFKNLSQDSLSLLGGKHGTVFDFETLGGEELKRYRLRLINPTPGFPKESIVELKPGEQYSFEIPCRLFRVENKLRLQLDGSGVQYEVDEYGVILIADYAVITYDYKYARENYKIDISFTNNLIAKVAYELGDGCLIKGESKAKAEVEEKGSEYQH